jgi:hypothetical protein
MLCIFLIKFQLLIFSLLNSKEKDEETKEETIHLKNGTDSQVRYLYIYHYTISADWTYLGDRNCTVYSSIADVL